MSESVPSLDVRLDGRDRTAHLYGRVVQLTWTQFRLLECLLREPGRVLGRAELRDAAIAGGAVVLDRTIDVHIAALRRKLAVPGLIQTVHGKGYRIDLSSPPCSGARRESE